MAIYDDYTTTISASNPPIPDADRCDRTGLWELPLDDKTKVTNMNSPTNEAINAIFNLPSARQTFLWYHAAAGFPVKESSIKAVRNRNYATWPKLTVLLIHKYMLLTRQQKATSRANAKGSVMHIIKFVIIYYVCVQKCIKWLYNVFLTHITYNPFLYIMCPY